MVSGHAKRGIVYSAGLHLAVLLFALFGLPHIGTPVEPEPFVVSIEVVAVAPVTNVPKQTKPLRKAEPKPQQPKPQPPKPKPEIIEKEVPPPPEEKPEEKPAEKKETLDELMKRLQEEAAEREEETEPEAEDTPPEENTTRSDAPYDDSLPLALSEKDAIRSQFVRCWRMPAGAVDAHTLAVRIDVEVNPDGSVKKAELASGQSRRYASDRFFRAAADSALRAVKKCSPLQNLPPEKYGSWREMELNFDPRELYF